MIACIDTVQGVREKRIIRAKRSQIVIVKIDCQRLKQSQKYERGQTENKLFFSSVLQLIVYLCYMQSKKLEISSNQPIASINGRL